MLQPQGVTVGSLNLASMEDMEFAQNLGEWLYSSVCVGGGGGGESCHYLVGPSEGTYLALIQALHKVETWCPLLRQVFFVCGTSVSL